MNLPLCVVTLYSLFTFEKKKNTRKEKSREDLTLEKFLWKLRGEKKKRKKEIRARNFEWNDKTILFQPWELDWLMSKEGVGLHKEKVQYRRDVVLLSSE